MVTAWGQRAVVLGCLTASLSAACTTESPQAPSASATSSARSSATEVPVAEAAWLPSPWALESSTRSAPLSAAEPEYLFCDWRVPPSRIVTGSRTAVTEQLLRHPDGRHARLIKYETDTAGGMVNLFKMAYDACLRPGGARSVPGPRVVWVHRGSAGGADFGAGGVMGTSESSHDLGASSGGVPMEVARHLHVVEVRGDRPGFAPTRHHAAAVLGAWRGAS